MSSGIFIHLMNTGLEKSKSYGSALAQEIEIIHKTTGQWPTSLQEIAPQRRPKFDKSDFWPYIYFEEDGLYDKVGGFFILYSVEKQQPELYVGRRDINFIWNWKDSRWEEKTEP